MKRGAIFRTCLIWACSAFLSLSLPFSFLQTASAAVAPLEVPHDFIGSTGFGLGNIVHEIGFTLPLSASQVTPSDWILIDMGNFAQVTLPTELSGSGIYGNASFSKVGNIVRITNIVMLPGTSIEINGLSAQNPQAGQDFFITISISGDANGTTIRNQSHFQVTEAGAINNVSATVKTSLAGISLSGFTSPGSFVTLTEDASAIGTTSADGTGFFNFSINGLNPGDHVFRILSTDHNNNSTSQAVQQLFLLPDTLTSVSGILMSPAFNLDQTEIEPGDALTLTGTAKPNSTINIFIESPLRSYNATSNNNGDWTYTIAGTETTSYSPGQYRAYTNVQDSLGNQSIVSPTVQFQVTSPDTGNNPDPACDISHGDLNCDGTTNLVDFSILLFHWQTNHKVADINKDQTVNLVDFSIMMFYFVR